MQLMQLACVFPIVLILGLLAIFLIFGSGLRKPLDQNFKPREIGRSQKKGHTKIEYLLMFLAVSFFIMSIAPSIIETLLKTFNQLWLAMNGTSGESLYTGLEDFSPMLRVVSFLIFLLCLGALGLSVEKNKKG